MNFVLIQLHVQLLFVGIYYHGLLKDGLLSKFMIMLKNYRFEKHHQVCISIILIYEVFFLDEDDEIKAEIESLTAPERAKSLTNFFSFIRAYLRQSVFPAAFALALLYMTVLGFDGLAVSHGKAQGLSEGIIGVFRSISSALGIVGAFLYTLCEQKMGVRKTGLMGLIVSFFL